MTRSILKPEFLNQEPSDHHPKWGTKTKYGDASNKYLTIRFFYSDKKYWSTCRSEECSQCNALVRLADSTA